MTSNAPSRISGAARSRTSRAPPSSEQSRASGSVHPSAHGSSTHASSSHAPSSRVQSSHAPSIHPPASRAAASHTTAARTPSTQLPNSLVPSSRASSSSVPSAPNGTRALVPSTRGGLALQSGTGQSSRQEQRNGSSHTPRPRTNCPVCHGQALVTPPLAHLVLGRGCMHARSGTVNINIMTCHFGSNGGGGRSHRHTDGSGSHHGRGTGHGTGGEVAHSRPDGRSSGARRVHWSDAS